jgi:hypothetical protein
VRCRHIRLFCELKTYGFDVLVDDMLRVWLIEVNRNPGFDYEGRLYCREPPMDYVSFAQQLAAVFVDTHAVDDAAPLPVCEAATAAAAQHIDVAALRREIAVAAANSLVEVVVPDLQHATASTLSRGDAAQDRASSLLRGVSAADEWQQRWLDVCVPGGSSA